MEGAAYGASAGAMAVREAVAEHDSAGRPPDRRRRGTDHSRKLGRARSRAHVPHRSGRRRVRRAADVLPGARGSSTITACRSSACGDGDGPDPDDLAPPCPRAPRRRAHVPAVSGVDVRQPDGPLPRRSPAGAAARGRGVRIRRDCDRRRRLSRHRSLGAAIAAGHRSTVLRLGSFSNRSRPVCASVISWPLPTRRPDQPMRRARFGRWQPITSRRWWRRRSSCFGPLRRDRASRARAVRTRRHALSTPSAWSVHVRPRKADSSCGRACPTASTRRWRWRQHRSTACSSPTAVSSSKVNRRGVPTAVVQHARRDTARRGREAPGLSRAQSRVRLRQVIGARPGRVAGRTPCRASSPRIAANAIGPHHARRRSLRAARPRRTSRRRPSRAGAARSSPPVARQWNSSMYMPKRVKPMPLPVDRRRAGAPARTRCRSPRRPPSPRPRPASSRRRPSPSGRARCRESARCTSRISPGSLPTTAPMATFGVT